VRAHSLDLPLGLWYFFLSSAHGDVSPNGDLLAISNLDQGLDLFSVHSLVLKKRLGRKVIVNRPHQVTFGLSGRAVITGSDQGVLVYDIQSGNLLSTLMHPVPKSSYL